MMSYDELLVQRISNREPFHDRDATAYYNGTEYQIWSYGLKIASVNSVVGNTSYYGLAPERWWLRPIIFEQTQLRIQNIVREIGETVKDWEILVKLDIECEQCDCADPLAPFAYARALPLGSNILTYQSLDCDCDCHGDNNE